MSVKAIMISRSADERESVADVDTVCMILFGCEETDTSVENAKRIF